MTRKDRMKGQSVKAGVAAGVGIDQNEPEQAELLKNIEKLEENKTSCLLARWKTRELKDVKSKTSRRHVNLLNIQGGRRVCCPTNGYMVQYRVEILRLTNE